MLLEDEFVSVFLSKLKSFAEKFSSQELKSSFFKLEEDLNSNKKEMKNLTDCFIESLKSFITNTEKISPSDSKINSNKIVNLNSDEIDSLPVSIMPNEGKVIIKESQSIPTSASGSGFKSEETRISSDLGIDELLEYIHTNDLKQEIKKNRRNSRKKQHKNLEKKNKGNRRKSSTHDIINETAPTCNDEVVDLFKKSIAEANNCGLLRRKIKPKISKDWIRNIVDIVDKK